MAQTLPLVPSVPHYRVGTALDGVQYVIDVRWNGRLESWFLDLRAEDESPIALGLRVTLGALIGGRVADARFPRGVLIASDRSGAGRDPALDDLGERVVVNFIPALELAS
jgi:hypothetical protein